MSLPEPAAFHWLDELIPEVPLGACALVLCRSHATVLLVRRWLASRGGRLGIEVATPGQLARQRAPARLFGAPPPSAATATLHQQFDRRPGLAAHARRHARYWRKVRAADPSLRAPEWLVDLEDAGAGIHPDVEAQIDLLDVARDRRGQLGPAHRYQQVIPLGFDHGTTDPWEHAVAAALCGAVHAANPPPGAIEGLRVPDVAAEARWVTQQAAKDPTGCLVLYSEAATALRIRAALERSGVPCSFEPDLHLAQHQLAGALRVLVSWVGEDDPWVRAEDLIDCMSLAATGHRLPPEAEGWLFDAIDAHELPDPVHALSRAAITRALEPARQLEAPLSRWMAHLRAMGEDVGQRFEKRTRSDAWALLARLEVLGVCARGESLAAHFDVPEAEEDWGEDDVFVARLLSGDADLDEPEDDIPIAPAHTLGALRRYLMLCRNRPREDEGAIRLIGRLAGAVAAPATSEALDEVLRSAVPSGLTRLGVDLVHIDDYDGRPSRLLLAVDVHDRGIVRVPAPDPLLDERELRALGTPAGPDWVHRRLVQLRSAAEASTEPLVVVTERDPTGRPVIPPVGLTVLWRDTEDTGTYGHRLILPEQRRWRALAVRPVDHPLPKGESRAHHLALQAAVEWVRAGRGPYPERLYGPRSPGDALASHLRRSVPIAPAPLLPWLGVSSGTEAARLPEEKPHSVTGLFGALTNCMYRSYAHSVLGVFPAPRLDEGVDPRDLGRAAHDALERASIDARWRATSRGDLLAQQEALQTALQRATRAAFEDLRTKLPLTPTQAHAADGLEARWQAHWSSYVEARLSVASTRIDRKKVSQLTKHHPLVDHATRRLLDDAVDLPQVPTWMARGWLCVKAEQLADNGQVDTRSDAALRKVYSNSALPPQWTALLREWAESSELRQLANVVQQARVRVQTTTAAEVEVLTEVPFGDADSAGGHMRSDPEIPVNLGPISLPLGSRPLPVRGRIDRITRVHTPKAPLLLVEDAKTSPRAPDREMEQHLRDLRAPQVAVYALVLEEALKTLGEEHPWLTYVGAVGIDWVRARADGELLEPTHAVFDPVTLKYLTRWLGWQVDEARAGRWWLAPHPKSCPKLASWATAPCPYSDACRLRASTLREES